MIAKTFTLLFVVAVANAQTNTANQQPEFDWDTLRTLMTEACDGGNLNPNGALTNISQFQIPQSDLPTLASLSSVPYANWLAQNSTPLLNEWDTPTLKSWIQNYIVYHNAAAANFPANQQAVKNAGYGNQEFPGVTNTTDDLGAGGDKNRAIEAPIANTFGLGNNQPAAVNLSAPTPIDQNLTFSNIWDPSFDNLPFQGALQQLERKADNVLFETFSFFTLLFGSSGIISNGGLNSLTSAQQSA